MGLSFEPDDRLAALTGWMLSSEVRGVVGALTSVPGAPRRSVTIALVSEIIARGHDVVHVVFGDTVEHVRDHYDTVHHCQTPTHHALGVRALVERERHRWLLGFEAPAPGRVARAISFLKTAMGCRPRLLVLEGLEAAQWSEHWGEVEDLADNLGCLVWVGMGADEDMGDPFRILLRVDQCGEELALKLEVDGSPALDPVTLDGSTFLPRVLPVAGGDASTEGSQCTLFSGGAPGAEAAFGRAASQYGISEVNYTFDGHQQDRAEGTRLLSSRELAAGDVSLVHVSRKLRRTYSSDPDNIRKVLQLLWHVVSRSKQVFVVGAIQEDDTVRGGTGWAVELGRTWNKEVWVFDQPKACWFRWSENAWLPGNPEIRSAHFCGTGTRELDDGGQRAIDALFERSFGS